MTKEDKIRENIELSEFDTKFIEMLKMAFKNMDGELLTELTNIVKEYIPAYKDVIVEFMDGYYTEDEIDTLNEITNDPKMKAIMDKSTKAMMALHPIADKFFSETLMKDERTVKILESI